MCPDVYVTENLVSLHNLSNKNYLELSHIVKRQHNIIAPWTSTIEINTELHSLSKHNTHPEIYKNYLNKILLKYKDYQELYTDASKKE